MMGALQGVHYGDSSNHIPDGISEIGVVCWRFKAFKRCERRRPRDAGAREKISGDAEKNASIFDRVRLGASGGDNGRFKDA